MKTAQIISNFTDLQVFFQGFIYLTMCILLYKVTQQIMCFYRQMIICSFLQEYFEISIFSSRSESSKSTFFFQPLLKFCRFCRFSLFFFYFHQFSVIFFNLQQIFQPYKCSKCLLDLNVLIFSFFFQPLLKFLQIFSILLFSPMFNDFQLFFQSYASFPAL